MAQCTGNCFKCDLVPEQDKMACCSIQTLRNVIEVKALLKQAQADKPSANLSGIPIFDNEPDTPAGDSSGETK